MAAAKLCIRRYAARPDAAWRYLCGLSPRDGWRRRTWPLSAMQLSLAIRILHRTAGCDCMQWREIFKSIGYLGVARRHLVADASPVRLALRLQLVPWRRIFSMAHTVRG